MYLIVEITHRLHKNLKKEHRPVRIEKKVMCACFYFLLSIITYFLLKGT